MWEDKAVHWERRGRSHKLRGLVPTLTLAQVNL
jgi:hypothetical protein